MKKTALVMATLVITVFLSACFLGVQNPLLECENVDKACEIVGFCCGTPECLPRGYEQSRVYTIEKSILGITYTGSGNEHIIYRAAKNEKQLPEISGVHENYDVTSEIDIDGVTLTVKGIRGNVYHLAYWKHNGNCFSMYTSAGFSLDDMIRMVKSSFTHS